ncbi:hypothetical protein ACI75Y_01650 [Capnocytophaga stomatis]|uniref:hypothetical protein n=1 Tax=Capnocytophaga stomatis TaxID=1848904 RepID=UPI00385D9101
MKQLNKSIPLRPRFVVESEKSAEILLERTKELKTKLTNEYKIVISDRQIWIHIHRNQRKYFSPHLNLELQPEEKGTRIRALFGPDPGLWTFFMFLHFIVAGIFMFFAIAAYSHHLLKESYVFDLIMMGLMVVLWFSLYFFARITRTKGVPQMYELKSILDKIIQ